MSEPAASSGSGATELASERGGWLGQGAWALADQGFASAANFLANVLLARALDPADYGAFAVAYQSFWLLFTLHAALVAEPLLVLAPGRFREVRSEYLRTVVLGQFGVAGACTGLIALVAGAIWAFGQSATAAAFVGLAIATPALLTLLTLRRIAFACFQARRAALAGAAHLALSVGGLVALQAGGRLGVLSAFVVLGTAAALAAALVWRPLAPRNPFAPPWPIAGAVAGEHRRYGAWGAAAGALAWVPGNAYYLILPWLPGAAFGLAATATLRALVNLIMPLLQANAALGSLLIPMLSARRRAGGRGGVAPLALALIGVAVAGAVALVLVGEPLLSWLYDGRYTADRWLFALLGLVPALTAGAHLLRGAVLANERPDQAFWANLAAAVAAIVLGLPLVLRFGLPGVLVAMALGPAAQIVVLGWQAFRSTDPSPG